MSPLPPVLVLAGGLGTRLRPLTDAVPKVLLPVLGKPFIEHVLEDLLLQGFSRHVLSVGHLAERVEACLGDGSRLGCMVSYVREETPLGTGGAVRHALSALPREFLLVNGDTLLELDLVAMLDTHRRQGQLVTLAAAHVPDRGRYGALELESGRVVRFEEKRTGAGPGPINGGVMVIARELLAGAPPGPFSLERDWLPRFAGRIAAYETRGYFVDIGTHDALATLEQDLGAFLDRRGVTPRRRAPGPLSGPAAPASPRG